MAGDKPGPAHWLDNEDNFRRIRKLAIKGLSCVAIAEDIGVSEKTLDDWKYHNSRGFKDLLMQWKHERMLGLAENNLEEILDMEVGFNEKLLKIKADVSKYTTGTLGNDIYKTKTETVNTVIVSDKDKNKAGEALNDFLEPKDNKNTNDVIRED